MPFRSILFVPGASPDRFNKAAQAKADAVCIDLEDSVAIHLKKQSREAVTDYLSMRTTGTPVGVRINPMNSVDGLLDVVALVEKNAQPDFIMLPKVESHLELNQLKVIIGDECPIWPTIESPIGLSAANSIALAVSEEACILFGGADFAASLGSDMSWHALHHARGVIVNAAAISGSGALDVPYLDVKDEEGLRAESKRVRAMGFAGRACIHPLQVSVINEVFSPTAEELLMAQKIVAAYKEAKGGVALLDGKLIEKPILRSAERLLKSRGK